MLLANHEDKNIIFDGHKITVQRGQYLTSIRKLSVKWKWGKNKTLSFLRLLEDCEMIKKESDSRRTLITVVNYDIYQSKDNIIGTVTGQSEDSNGTVTGHRQATNKNIKNDKNDKKGKNNKYMCAFDEFWRNYPRKKDKSRAYKCYQARLKDGYTEDQLLAACINYAAECMKNRTEERYIKHGATFLSVNEPFLDYLKGDNSGRPETDNGSEERRIAELKEYLKSDEFKAGGNLPFM